MSAMDTMPERYDRMGTDSEAFKRFLLAHHA
jgi:hypothetical protein